MSWKLKVVPVIRTLVSDLEYAQYDDDRILMNFMFAANFVSFDVKKWSYEIDTSAVEITPDPSDDQNFITLSCLKCACMMLNSELKTKLATTGRKVTMKDGPSEITMDRSSELASLKEFAKSACDKYEEALFQFNAGNSIGISITGPQTWGVADTQGSTTYPEERNVF